MYSTHRNGEIMYVSRPGLGEERKTKQLHLSEVAHRGEILLILILSFTNVVIVFI